MGQSEVQGNDISKQRSAPSQKNFHPYQTLNSTQHPVELLIPGVSVVHTDLVFLINPSNAEERGREV